MAINDDLSSTLTVHQVADTRSKIDCPIDDPDAILQIMFSGRHISVNWTIMGRSSLCYLMKGRRLGPMIKMIEVIDAGNIKEHSKRRKNEIIIANNTFLST